MSSQAEFVRSVAYGLFGIHSQSARTNADAYQTPYQARGLIACFQVRSLPLPSPIVGGRAADFLRWCEGMDLCARARAASTCGLLF